ncbi:MAG: hypothetical protein U9R25_06325 [Chloroflexota bacterium]|nr:hypothetical protein [Chloroflexota bacterium]
MARSSLGFRAENLRHLMGWQIALFVVLGILFAWTGSATAGDSWHPLLQGNLAQITSPEPLSNVRGNVSIMGTATHPQFQRYELYYTVEPGENWVFIGEAHFNPVAGGLLGTWNTESLPDSTYSLRLRVVRQDGNYGEAYQRNIVVANSAPTPTPTPFELPTVPARAEPTATATVDATSTPVTVEQPDIPTPTPRPSPIPTEESQAVAVDSINDDSGFFSSALDFDSLRGAFTKGLAYAGAIFLAVGAFFGVRRLLTWIWYLIAP